MNEINTVEEYSIGLGKIGSQVLVWDTSQIEEPKKLAEVSPNHTVTYLAEGLPAELQEVIQEIAGSIEFFEPPTK